MKKIVLLMAIPMLLQLSCEKDSDKPNGNDPDYYILYEGVKYAVDKAVATHRDSSPEIFKLYLLASNVTFLSYMGINEVIGIGNGMEFTLVSTNSNSFNMSIYVMDTTDNYLDPGELHSVAFRRSWDWEDYSGGGGTSIYPKQGNCIIIYENGKYTINLDLMTADNKPMKAYFKGSVPIHVLDY